MDNLKLLIGPIAIAIFLIVCPVMSAQETNQTSRKFDEFIGELDHEDLIARLDNFSIELQNQLNVKAHIIVYRSRRDPPGISHRYALLARDYLVKVRGIDRSRLVTVDGGRTGCLMYELWIVPPGAASPERRFTYRYPIERHARRRR